MHRRDDDVHVGDATIGGPGLGAVEDPLVVGFVVARAGEDGADVGARTGFRGAERRKLADRRRCRTSAAAIRRAVRVCRWRPATPRPSRCPGSTARYRRRPRTSPRRRPACPRPDGSAACVGEQLHRVEADLRRFLDDRPRRFLALVPLGAAGRTTSAANSCTQSRTWITSGESSRENDMNRTSYS